MTPENMTPALPSPDCGFAPGSGALVSIDEACRKPSHEAAAALMLREEFA